MTTAQHNHSSPPPYSVPRRLPRYKMDVRVRVSIVRRKQLFHARSTDLSEGGLAFFAPVEVEVGEPIAMEFTLPYTRHPQKCAAVVRNRSGYRYGVQFRELTDAAREAIARVCKTLALLV